MSIRPIAVWFLLVLLAQATIAADRPDVEVLRTPDGGIQPQAVVDPTGTIHLVYFKGDPSHGDLFYVHREPKSGGFSKPVRVNSEPEAAVAMGTIRGAQLAVGRAGRVHVAWNGSRPDFKTESPMLTTRLNPATGRFEPQRNLMTRTRSLDGGGTVAADSEGRVYVAWHARGNDAPEGEVHRRLYVARSIDDGETFIPERIAGDRETGACACCGTRALADNNGNVYVIYRGASDGGKERDLILFTSHDHGDRFRGGPIGAWRINACPMSSASMAGAPGGPIAAWETAGQVFFAKATTDATPIAPPGEPGDRKHPAVAVGDDGRILLAWTEGTGWQRGGSLVWQVFDKSGRPMDVKGRVDRGIPVWSLPTAVTRPGGGFTVIH